MKRKIVVIIGLIILTSLGIFIILNNKNKPYEIKDTNNGQFAFFYEDENGEYQRSTESKWNTGKYILNLESSTCDGESNPSFLSWNNNSNSVTLTRNKATKCSLYFDIKPFDMDCNDDLLSCFIAKKQGTSVGDNNEELIYHNNTIDIDNDGIYDDAGDLSYRYAGDNPDNFVCFGTDQSPCPVENLYRIIGVFPVTKEDGSVEYQVKLIKSEYITGSELETEAVAFQEFSSTYADLIRIQNIPSDGFYWDDNGGSAWKDSTLFTLLNTNYFNKTLTSDWQKIISSVNWHTGSVAAGFAVTPQRMYTKETKLETINSPIGLMYVSDYGFASSKINWSKKVFCSTENDESCYNGDTNRRNNWLFNSTFEWTIVNSGSTVIDTNWFGDCHSHTSNQFAHHARPVFYLTANTLYLSGKGTSDDPYIIGNSYDYNYKSEAQEFIAPVDGDYKIELWGASGGYSGDFAPGKGAYTTGIISLKANDKLYVYVGEEGHSSMDENSTTGTFNGGGSVGFCRRTTNWGGSGGGATDIRILNGEWSSFNSLESRIMVAAGGGAANTRGKDDSTYANGNGGSGGTLKGLDGDTTVSKDYGIGYGGTQTSGGKSTYYMNTYTQTASGFGYSNSIRTASEACSDNVSNSENNWPWSTQSGGGGGYYGGGSSLHGGAGGGSSYISGYQGCVAIEDTSLEGNIIPKCTEDNALNNIECSYHYSGKRFTSTNMKAGNESMPSPNGGMETGHSGNGYARITLINYDENAIDLSGNGYDGNFIGNLNIQKDDEGRQGLYFDGNESYVDIADLPETIKWNDGFSYEFEAKWLAFNYYSRIFDFGNGAGLDNIVFCTLQRLSRAFPSILYGYKHYEDDSSAVTGLVLNKSVKVKVSYEKTDNGFNEIIYKDGELARTKFYETENLVTEVNRTLNYLGKSNWSGEEYFNGYIYNIKFTDSTGKTILWYDFSK